jgi:hypothetical protein
MKPIKNRGRFTVRRKFGWWYLFFYDLNDKFIAEAGPFSWAEADVKESTRAMRMGFKKEDQDGTQIKA